MRILQIFNQYLEPGGEEFWVNQMLRLADENFEIQDLRFQSRAWQGHGGPSKIHQVRLLGDNPDARRRLREAVQEFKPDALIFHNLIPVASLGLYEEATALGLPVYQYVHNFRPFSPSGTLWIRGRVNDAALRGNLWPEILAGAWEGSWLKTLVLAYHLRRLRTRKVLTQVTGWITVSDFMREKFIGAGLPAERVHTLRHCYEDHHDSAAAAEGDYYLFLGRLVPEKGIYTLRDAWRLLHDRLGPAMPKLVIAGIGPEQAHVCSRINRMSGVEWVGYVSGQEKDNLLKSCRALIAPSIWWEPLGLIVYEAYQFSRAVITSGSGGLRETVVEGVTGLLHTPGDPHSLAASIQTMEDADPGGRARMGTQGRKWLEENVSPDAWREKFLKIIGTAPASDQSIEYELKPKPGGMKVLAIHNHYQIRSGEDLAFEAAVSMLRNQGHTVILLEVHSRDYVVNWWTLPRVALGMIFSIHWFLITRRTVAQHRPDVALVQNVFPLISPSVYWALRMSRIPVVQRMFNYRPVCPNGVLYTQGAICERCVRGAYWNAVRFNCYRNSKSSSLMMALSLGIHRLAGMWRKTVALYLLPDRFLGRKLGVLGLSNDRFRLVPNPAPEHSLLRTPVFSNRGKQILFVGRIVREKGIFLFLEIARLLPDFHFQIVGSGEDEAEARQFQQRHQLTNVEFIGPLYGSGLVQHLEEVALLIVPSQWYDNIPLIITQAFLAGTPVLASDINGIPEYVIDHETGWLADPSDAAAFVSRIQWLAEHPDTAEQVARHARTRAEQWFMPGAADQALESALIEACNQSPT